MASQIFLRQLVIGAIGESRIVDPLNSWIIAQEFGDAARVRHMALNPQRQRFDALQQQESIEWRQHSAGRAQVDTATARDVCSLAEMVCID